MPRTVFPTRPINTLKTHNGKLTVEFSLSLHFLILYLGPVNAVSYSNAGGAYLLTGSSDRAIHLSRAIPNDSSGLGQTEIVCPIQKYEAHGYSVLDVAVATDNARFASVGGDRQMFLWDVEHATTIKRWSGHNSRIEAVQFAGDGDSVVVTGMWPRWFHASTVPG